MDIRAFLDRWTPDCQPMSFREEFKRLLCEVVRECSDQVTQAKTIETVKEAMR